MLSASTEYLLMLLSERIEADYLNSIMIDRSERRVLWGEFGGLRCQYLEITKLVCSSSLENRGRIKQWLIYILDNLGLFSPIFSFIEIIL